MTRQGAESMYHNSTYIIYRIMPLCKLQCKNRVRSITLKPFEIILENLEQIYNKIRRRAEDKTIPPSTIFVE